ncbi:MAG TPA: SPOR domain-containing protein [Cyclobacteriaceae bacterium]|nr:SPOR domain-containing protein [Cyclobacteriaceae bacterium]
MADEGFNHQDDKFHPDRDFGLPKVEIKPLVPSDEPETGPVGSGTVSPGDSLENTATAPAGAGPGTAPERKGSGFTWIIVLVFLLAAGLGAWFYFERNAAPVTDQKVEAPVEMEKPRLETPPPKTEEVVPEEPVAKVTLTPIQSRADRPRYFVVVGSFIDEDMARDFSNKLNQKEINTYLVYPYGDIAFYRLAVGQFESFALAAEEIARIKGDYKEDLWVLKY